MIVSCNNDRIQLTHSTDAHTSDKLTAEMCRQTGMAVKHFKQTQQHGCKWRCVNRLAVTLGCVKVICTWRMTLASEWDVLVLTRLEERGEAFCTTQPDQRPAGESADYQGKNNTHTLYRAAGIIEEEREKER